MDSHDAADHMEHDGGHGIIMCDGSVYMYEGGSWIGHFGPGMIFLVWGLHWMQAIYRNYFNSRRIKGQEYRAQTTHTLWRFPVASESICKAFFPIIALSAELYFVHRGGFRTMICPPGTTMAGHFYGPHMNNWQHAAMYPPFILSGIVDLVGLEVDLPPGTQQVFLFLAFLCEALLMGLHKKHTPLDIAVHSILFYTMLATATLVLVEAVHPRNFLVSCGRVASTFVQSGWLFAAAHIMFKGGKTWDEMGGADMAPTMMVSVLFVGLIVLVATFMLLSYLIFHAYYKLVDGRIAAYERAGLLDEDRNEGRPPGSSVPLAPLGCNHDGTSCQV